MSIHEENVVATDAHAQRAIAQVERSSKVLRALSLVVGLAVLAAVVTFGVISYRQADDARARLDKQQTALLAQQTSVLAILHAVQDATNPNSPLSQAAAARTQATVDQLIRCVDVEVHREGALIRNVPEPPPLAGCPVTP